MRNDGQKSGRANGFIPSSFKTISSYLRIVSSGASNVASTVRSAASAIVDRDEDTYYNQVLWAGFDKLDYERDVERRVLLLGYRSGFQVWDVEEAHNVLDLVSRHDGPVSFLQMLPRPLSTMAPGDKFYDSRPLMAVCTAGSPLQEGIDASCNGSLSDRDGYLIQNGYYGSSTVKFYSLTSQSYVHVLKFRSVVLSVRCSSRVLVVSQATQVHCFNAASLEREYTILTNPVSPVGPLSGGMGYGPLALGPRWLAYSGSPVEISDADYVIPRHLTPSATFPNASSNGNRVAHFAKESSKHLATGIVTLGDIGYKKLSRYCSELRPDSNHPVQSGGKANGIVNRRPPSMDKDNVGMVIIKDVVSKAVIAQFRAHKSPISALCFDPSGVLLVTSSVHGHNINIFRILPGGSSVANSSGSYVHLYRLQRCLTDAIIQDITFSDDSHWIMISSSRGTNHLFAISPFGGPMDLLGFADSRSNGLNAIGNPITLSVVSRIRNGNNGWKGTMNGVVNPLPGAIAASFYLCEDKNVHFDPNTLNSKYHLLVFSPSGCLIQYALRVSLGSSPALSVSGINAVYGSAPGNGSKLVIEPTRKWDIPHKCWKREDNFDIYGENGKGNSIPSSGKYVTAGSMISHEERNHFFISQAELHMHEQVPLWARAQIFFETMMADGIKLDGGETAQDIEIEKISTRMIEAKSKDLVPVLNSLDNPKSQLARMNVSKNKSGSQALPDKVSKRGNLLSDLTTENDAELYGGIPFKHANMTTGSVYTNHRPQNILQYPTVNNRDRERLKMEAHHKIVNNDSEASKMENHVEDEGEDEEFD